MSEVTLTDIDGVKLTEPLESRIISSLVHPYSLVPPYVLVITIHRNRGLCARRSMNASFYFPNRIPSTAHTKEGGNVA